jgi:hypothetical protein
MSLYIKAIDNCIIANGGKIGQFLLRGDDTYENIIQWFCDELQIPSKEQVEEEFTKLKAEWDRTAYQRHRSRIYPNLSELADALYHKEKTGDNTLLENYIGKCDEVKQKFPKDNSGNPEIFVNPEGAPILQ